MAPPLKRKKQQQPTITEHALPQLKKPMEAVGKQVEFPGSFWGGRMSPEELRTLYKCTVRDFSLAHKFPGQLAPGPGFELQEMGAAARSGGVLAWGTSCSSPAGGTPRAPAAGPA